MKIKIKIIPIALFIILNGYYSILAQPLIDSPISISTSKEQYCIYPDINFPRSKFYLKPNKIIFSKSRLIEFKNIPYSDKGIPQAPGWLEIKISFISEDELINIKKELITCGYSQPEILFLPLVPGSAKLEIPYPLANNKSKSIILKIPSEFSLKAPIRVPLSTEAISFFLSLKESQKDIKLNINFLAKAKFIKHNHKKIYRDIILSNQTIPKVYIQDISISPESFLGVKVIPPKYIFKKIPNAIIKVLINFQEHTFSLVFSKNSCSPRLIWFKRGNLSLYELELTYSTEITFEENKFILGVQKWYDFSTNPNYPGILRLDIGVLPIIVDLDYPELTMVWVRFITEDHQVSNIYFTNNDIKKREKIYYVPFFRNNRIKKYQVIAYYFNKIVKYGPIKNWSYISGEGLIISIPKIFKIEKSNNIKIKPSSLLIVCENKKKLSSSWIGEKLKNWINKNPSFGFKAFFKNISTITEWNKWRWNYKFLKKQGIDYLLAFNIIVNESKKYQLKYSIIDIHKGFEIASDYSPIYINHNRLIQNGSEWLKTAFIIPINIQTLENFYQEYEERLKFIENKKHDVLMLIKINNIKKVEKLEKLKKELKILKNKIINLKNNKNTSFFSYQQKIKEILKYITCIKQSILDIEDTIKKQEKIFKNLPLLPNNALPKDIAIYGEIENLLKKEKANFRGEKFIKAIENINKARNKANNITNITLKQNILFYLKKLYNKRKFQIEKLFNKRAVKYIKEKEYMKLFKLCQDWQRINPNSKKFKKYKKEVSKKLYIKVSCDKKVYHIGEKCYIKFETSFNCYLILICQEPDGNIYILIPNQYQGPKFLKGVHIIPSEDYELVQEGPLGETIIKAFASDNLIQIPRDLSQLEKYPYVFKAEFKFKIIK